ncbi:MAG: hypothetical protein OK449_01145 [Thaumarchaeota archaeon]|nr:hypothetical protein [Nitrososphaerota archaeon]
MTELITMLPVLPGKRAEAEKFVATLLGPKWKQYDRSQKIFKIRRETWFLTSTAHGDYLVFYAEGDDIIKSFKDWVLSEDPFEKWVKREMKKISGVDPDVPSDDPLPKQLLRYGY